MPDDTSLGRAVQAVRLSHNLRQADVAARAGVSADIVSRLERGLVDGMTVGSLRSISRALAMPPLVTLGWRTPEFDRLRDRLHAALVEATATRLEALGWELAPESSFNHYGERGSADILAWHAGRRALLVVEVKTRLWDLQDLLAGLDVKRRVLPGQAARRWGWSAAAVGVVLVLPEISTHRHVVEQHAATFRAALPDRQHRVRGWLADPESDLRGIWFLPISHHNGIEQRAFRIRASRRLKNRRTRPGTAPPRRQGPSRQAE
jgi:transcriptional regulator with XRE-family HTH domain